MLISHYLGLATPLGLLALLIAILVLYKKTRSIALIAAAISVGFLCLSSAWGYFYRPNVSFDEEGYLVSGNMPPQWLIFGSLIAERTAYLVMGIAFLMFARSLPPNKGFNRTLESSGSAKPGELGGGAG